MKYLYTVSKDMSKVEHYGLKLAEIAGFPSSVVEKAREYAGRIEQRAKQVKELNKLTHEEVVASEKIKVWLKWAY